MIVPRLLAATPVLLLCLVLAPWPALPQTSSPPGVLTLPKKKPSVAATPASPAQAAPVAPVQQVAPLSTPRAPAAPAKPYVPAPNSPAQKAPLHKSKRPTPVVQAPPNVHAKRASGGPAAAAGKPAPSAATPGTAIPAVVVPPALAGTGAQAHGSVTNLPVPRWASLRADEVNLRVGPGLRFPIDWEYHRRDLPVEILREVEVWRLIRDQDGVKGWVHQATLKGQRSFVVKVTEAVVRRAASEDAAPVARLKAGVVGRIRACEAGAAWCEVQSGDYRGWLRREQFFGTSPGEAVGN